MICSNLSINDAGRLYFAGVDAASLAAKHGTPLYVMDEDLIRAKCRLYIDAMNRSLGGGSRPLYASKACSFKHIYEIMKDEGMAVDLVSPGEIHTAYKAGFPMENAYFHGNNKTDSDIQYAVSRGVGYIVADNFSELMAIDAAAKGAGITQKILLRLTPGIDPHTYDAVATGKVDSKFGVAVETGQAEEFVKAALGFDNLEIYGYHCHVGSQVFDEDNSVYLDAAGIMLGFAADMYHSLALVPRQVNLGGGYGVRYVESDPCVDIAANIQRLGAYVKEKVAALNMPMPAILLEPGRSIVADAGLTLYTVGSVKRITGYKNYVSIDGGMTDNPRYALYGSKYTVYLANRAGEVPNLHCDLVGRCCESGDVIQPDIDLPEPQRGDIVAVCTTGAYNYSMASNYNRVARPPIVMVYGGKDTVAVRRETLDDLVALDI